MAKRKRLTPANPAIFGADPVSDAPTDVRRKAPPIAEVAGDASARNALETLSSEMSKARAEGRLMQSLPLGAIDEGHLVRDRMVVNDDDMSALMASIEARGQQTPIEVVDLGGGKYGLISGWRRLAAMRALRLDTGDERFETIKALLRAPESASEAYLAMVEENEIRVGLSYYERARVAEKAAELGVYPSGKKAVLSLFAAASRAKRSKIHSFRVIYGALDGVLKFPTAITERLGLQLAKALEEDARFAATLTAALTEVPLLDPEGELEVLTQELAQRAAKPNGPSALPAEELFPGLIFQRKNDQIVLKGKCVTPAFEVVLKEWLAELGYQS